jgi:hypothetical protein
LSKNKRIPKSALKKSTTVLSEKKLTPAQKKRLRKTLAKMPPIEKLDPAVYAKLQSSIRDAVAKTLPEYQRWVNSSVLAADDCPTQQCSSCGNDCPTQLCSACSNQCPIPVKSMDDMVVNAVNEAMMGAIRKSFERSIQIRSNFAVQKPNAIN